jgi:hypothetical protein
MIRKLATLALISTFVLVPTTAASAITLDVSNNFPSFENAGDLNIGEDAELGDVFDYEGIVIEDGVTVDARFTVLALDGFIGVFDAAEGPDSSPWGLIFSQLRFQEEENGGGKVRYLVEFTDNVTGDPVELSGLSFSVRDVDETQYIQSTHVESYELSSSPATELDVITPNDNASVPEGEIRFASPSIGVDSDDEEYWVTLNLEDVSSFTLELGQRNYDDFEWAYYYLDFDMQSWTNEPTETDTPLLTRDETLAPTGAVESVLPIVALSVMGLLAIGFVLRRRTS